MQKTGFNPFAKRVQSVPSELSEDALVDALRNRDEAAYHHAVEKYTGSMLATARTMLDSAAAEDVVQEAWLSVMHAIDGFEGRSGLKSWLCRITANKAKNHLRKHKRESLQDDFSALESDIESRFSPDGRWANPFHGFERHSPSDNLERDVMDDCLQKHLSKMPGEHSSALLLIQQAEMSKDDVASLLGVSVGNVRVMVHRARQRLVLMLERLRETGEC